MQTNKERVPMCTPVLDMSVGQVGYISIWSITIKIEPKENKPTEFYRQINLVANVHPTQTEDATVKITRIGLGIQGSDYELDFSDCSQVIEFDESTSQTFKLATTPYAIEPHFVTKMEKYGYMNVDELEEVIKELLYGADKRHDDNDIKKIIEIIIMKVKKSLQITPFYDLFGAYEDAYEKTARFKPTESKKSESKPDYQLMLCEQIITQATKSYVESLLKEKFLTDFGKFDFEQREELAERITDGNNPLNFLEDLLYKIKI